MPAPRMAAVPASAPPVAVPCRAAQLSHSITIQWVLPEAVRDRTGLDEACAQMGPVVVQEAALRPATPGAITIVTWNTYLGRGDLDALVAEIGADAYVLLLQEVYRQDILSRARRMGLHAAFVPTLRRSSETDDRGNAILSTFPIGNLLVAELPFEKQRRLAVAGEILAAGPDGRPRSFHAVSMHFTTSLALTRGGPGAARERQARALVEALRGIPPPIIVGGDLNTWWGEDEPAVKLLRKAFPDMRRLDARDTWHGPLGMGTKLDYLFGRLRSGSDPDLRVRRLSDRFGSDHYPVMTVMRWTEMTEQPD